MANNQGSYQGSYQGGNQGGQGMAYTVDMVFCMDAMRNLIASMLLKYLKSLCHLYHLVLDMIQSIKRFLKSIVILLYLNLLLGL